jgi:hypothetical protein
MKMQSSEWHTVLSPDQRNHTSSDPRKKWCSLHSLTSFLCASFAEVALCSLEEGMW